MPQRLLIRNAAETILVDDDTFPVLARMPWWVEPKTTKRPYTLLPPDALGQRRKRVYLCRLLTEAQPKVHMVQHINGNVLDCRRSNLRLLSANSPERGLAAHPMNPPEHPWVVPSLDLLTRA